jgi:ATP-binding cassette subfamily B multidrug efflux pump
LKSYSVNSAHSRKSETDMHNIFSLAFFLKPYRKQSIAALLLLTAVVAMDLTIPRLIQRIIDEGIHQHNQDVVIQTGFLMLGISVLSVLFAVGNNILSVKVGESVARDLREALFLKIQGFSFGNIDRLKTGQLMVRLSSDVTAVQRVAQVTLRIGTRAPLLMIGSLILMIRTSSTLALTMLPLLFVTSLIIVFFVAKMEPLFRAVQQQLDRLNTVLQENVAGIRLIKAFVRDDFEFARFDKANQAFTGESIRVMKFMASMTPALILCVNAGMVLVIWLGLTPFAVNSQSARSWHLRTTCLPRWPRLSSWRCSRMSGPAGLLQPKGLMRYSI